MDTGICNSATNLICSGPNISAGGFLGIAINVIMGIAFGLGFVSIAYGLILTVTSKGEPKAVETARNAFLYGLLAVIIAFGAIAAKAITVGLLEVSQPDIVNPTPDI